MLVAALEQHQEAHAAEAPDDLLRVQGFLQQPRELDEDFFAGGSADVALEGRELVDA